MNKPDIRFNVFNGEWTEKKYTEVFDTSVSNNTLSRAELTTERTATKNVHYGDILIKYNSILDVKKDDFPFVPDEVKMDPRNFLKNGDIVFADTAEDETCGKATEINNLEHENVVAGLHTFVARPKNVFEEKYLGYFVNSPAYHNQLIPFMQGTKVTSISKSNIQKTSVKYPESAEQKKLGALFSQIDSLIASTQKEHDKLVALKKCMLQKMFPKKGSLVPEIRFEGFSGDWVEKKLGECITVSRGGSPRPIENYITTDEDGLNWVKIGDVEKNSRYIVQTAEKIKPSGLAYTRQVFVNDLILSNSMSFGRPYIMKIEGCIHDGWLLLRDEKKSFDLEFLVQLLSTDGMLEQYKALAAGGVVNNLNSELVQSTTLMFPSFEEQQKIGSYFQNLDNLISKQSAELEKLKNVKKTLLSKMFV